MKIDLSVDLEVDTGDSEVLEGIAQQISNTVARRRMEESDGFTASEGAGVGEAEG